MSVRFNASGESFSRARVTGAKTMMGWFRIVTDRDAYTAFLANNNNSILATEATGTALIFWDGSLERPVGVSAVVGTWVHLAYTETADDGNFVVYVDGVARLSTTRSNTASGTTMYVGNDGYDEWLNGNAAFVKVWSAVLTAAEIQQEMYLIRPKRLTNIHSWLPLLVHTSGVDYTGNGNNWTANGTLTTEDNPPISWGSSPQAFIHIPSAVGNLYEETITNLVNTFRNSAKQVNTQRSRSVLSLQTQSKQPSKSITRLSQLNEFRQKIFPPQTITQMITGSTLLQKLAALRRNNFVDGLWRRSHSISKSFSDQTNALFGRTIQSVKSLAFASAAQFITHGTIFKNLANTVDTLAAQSRTGIKSTQHNIAGLLNYVRALGKNISAISDGLETTQRLITHTIAQSVVTLTSIASDIFSNLQTLTLNIAANISAGYNKLINASNSNQVTAQHANTFTLSKILTNMSSISELSAKRVLNTINNLITSSVTIFTDIIENLILLTISSVITTTTALSRVISATKTMLSIARDYSTKLIQQSVIALSATVGNVINSISKIFSNSVINAAQLQKAVSTVSEHAATTVAQINKLLPPLVLDILVATRTTVESIVNVTVMRALRFHAAFIDFGGKVVKALSLTRRKKDVKWKE